MAVSKVIRPKMIAKIAPKKAEVVLYTTVGKY